ncbi:MAG: hypothetical protein AAGK22_09905 [Acidobacteriota bacterium]
MPPIQALRNTLLLVAIATLSAGSTRAESAEEWAAKALLPFEQAPFQLEFSADLTMQQGPTKLRMESQGTLLYRDARHSVTQMQTDVSANGTPSQSSTAHTIADGEHSWSFSVIKGQPHPQQILRSRLDDLEARAASEGGVLSVSGDPYSQLRAMLPRLALKVSEGDDVVTLNGTFQGQLPESLASQLQLFGSSPQVSVTLDRRTGEPQSMIIGSSGQPTLQVSFRSLKYLDAAATPRSSFAFEPPVGVPIFSP